MRWRPSGTSQVEDRRGSGGFGGGGLGGLGMGGGGIPIPVGGGVGGIVIVIIIFIVMQLLGGGGLGGSLGGLGGGTGGGDNGAVSSLDPGDNEVQFVNAVTVDVQTFWEGVFSAAGKTYTDTKTVVFTDQTNTGCGVASSATGPFYCPADKNIYLDMAFFQELADRFGAKGDFAHAYVIAHEYGHHVQDELGIFAKVQQQQTSGNANDLSIRTELQADCLAGVWAHDVWANPDQSNVESITQQDITDGLNAAASVGDDRIQQQATGTIDKESWTHGSAEQRTKWFNTGFQQGKTDACDTFAVSQP